MGKIRVLDTPLDGVKIIEPQLFGDARGYFFESFSAEKFEREVCRTRFVQDNESYSVRGVVRGMHYQLPPMAQSKLVRVVEGRILDVAVDIRRHSPSFGRWTAVELSAENHRQLFIPRGFAHGFVALDERNTVCYKCDNPYAPQSARAFAWNDPAVGIEWGFDPSEAILSSADALNPLLADSEVFDFFDRQYEE